MKPVFESLAEIERHNRSAALCTIIRARGSVPRHVGSKLLVYPDGHIEGTVGGGEMESRVIREALEALKAGEPRIVQYTLANPAEGDPGVCGGEMEIFIEPIKPAPTLLIIGGGHVGQALVHLGKWLGFRVVLSDDRPEFCNPEATPGADEYLPIPIRQLPITHHFHAETYIVLSTRGMPLDVDGLPHLLAVPHAYLGVIGSKRRWAMAVQRLAEKGLTAEVLARVHAPMGLELNAETPEEIALSILAEIVMLRRGGTGQMMKDDN